VLRSFAVPGGAGNDFDLDFMPQAGVIEGASVAAGSLLVSNGEVSQTYVVDPATGTVLAGPFSTFGGGGVVGGSYSRQHDTLGIVTWVDDLVRYLDPADLNTATSSFTVSPAGPPGFDIFYGDLDFAPNDGHIFLVSSSQNTIRELTDTGAFVQDIPLTGVNQMAGIAIDDTTGDGWIVDRGGNLCKLAGLTSAFVPPTETIAIGDAVADEGNVKSVGVALPITLSEAPLTDLFFPFTTVDGTATGGLKALPGVDYKSRSGTIKIKAGKTAGSVTTTIFSDTDDGDAASETVNVQLTMPSGYAALDDLGTITIRDDDPAAGPTASVGDSTIYEGDSVPKSRSTRVVIMLSEPTASDIVVPYALSGVTATLGAKCQAGNGVDAKTKAGNLTIRAGKRFSSISITVCDDELAESDETVTVQIGPVPGYTLTDDTGTYTIRDDDGLVVI
jgi:hypothetical protein